MGSEFHNLRKWETDAQLIRSSNLARCPLKAGMAVSHLKITHLAVLFQELEATLSRMHGEAVVTKAMKTQLDRLEELESENRKLKEENSYCK